MKGWRAMAFSVLAFGAGGVEGARAIEYPAARAAVAAVEQVPHGLVPG